MNKLLVTDKELHTLKRIMNVMSGKTPEYIKLFSISTHDIINTILERNADLISNAITNIAVDSIDDRKRLNIS